MMVRKSSFVLALCAMTWDANAQLQATDTGAAPAAEADPASAPPGSDQMPSDQTPVEPAPAPAEAATLDTIPVASDTPPDKISRAPSSSRLVEEVVVTAQKREENLRDVPISVAAFSAAQLDAKQVIDSADLPKITPGLTVTTQVGFASTFLRGVGSDAFILGDPSVVTYIDGVYFPFALGQVQDFGSVDHIEVLKGPQGTLFGRNALGGAIKIDTKAPNLEEPEFQVGGSYAENNSFKSRIYASVPLGETFAVSASGLYNNGESYLDGTQGINRDPLPRQESDAYRLKAIWKPNEWFQARLNYYHLAQNSGDTFAVNTQPTLLFSALIRPQDARHGVNNEDLFLRNRNRTVFGDLTFSTSIVDIKVLASDQLATNNQTYDFDGSPVPLAKFESNPGFADVQTGELQLLSNKSSPYSEWLEYIFGVYYFKSHAGFDPAFLAVGSIDLSRGTVAGLPIPSALQNVLSPILGLAPIPTGVALNFVGLLDTKSIAYYTQATAHITDWFALTLGGRFQDEQRIIDRSSSGVRNTNGTTTPIPFQNYSGYDDPAYRDTTKKFDPKVSLNFRPQVEWLGDAPLFYVNYQSATTSSTFNTINIYNAPEKVNGTKIKAYEVGAKTRIFNGLVDLNAAAFWYDIDQPQVQVVSLVAGGAVRLENAGGERIRGMDFDTVVQLFPDMSFGSLVATASAAYLDTEYTSYTNGSGFNPTTGLFTGNNDYTGNPVVRSPKFSGTAGLLQTISSDRGPIEIGLDYYYNSGFYYLAQADSSVEQKSYGTLGINLSYLYEPWQLRVTAFGRNVLNEDYLASRFRTDFGTNDTAAPLSIYGVRFDYTF
ncbi:MAG: outer rane receptor protein [Hydrocarboniphaga sp.]|uniref:TonB-dependent receptor n=1 Tax=Hydrocarboniphaga sp. TaxID=2033016 RepID=UPI002604C825|nr:TonB-dependent receptor [Hydrocarboniphaga sp.]MDB5969171.1 outer rane receptor protein [Hydrocarboniphaga sp.]